MQDQSQQFCLEQDRVTFYPADGGPCWVQRLEPSEVQELHDVIRRIMDCME